MKFLVTAFLFTHAVNYSLGIKHNCESICFSQKSFFGARGVVLKQVPSPDIIPFEKEYFMPSVAEAIKADSILLNNLLTKNGNSFIQNKKIFYNFDRQYIGFKKPDGSKNVLIHLIEHKSATRYINDYDNALMCNVVMTFCSNCKVDIRNYSVNISSNKIIDF